MNLGEQLRAVFDLAPDAPALEFKRRWYFWGELRRAMDRLDALLCNAGLDAQARIGVVLRNHPANAAAIALVAGTQRCLVALNPALPDERLAADIAQVAVPAVLASEDDWRRPGLRDAASASGALRLAFAGGASDLSFAVEEPARPERWSRARSSGVAVEMLTSGTTGPAKRIPLPTRNFAVGLEGWGSFEKGREAAAPRLRSGVQIHQAPFAHISGVQGILNVLLAGRKVVLLERFDVDEWHDAVVRHRPKVASAPPAALRMILERGYPQADLASLAIFRTGTAPLDPQLAREFHRRYGIPVLQNYGATEYAGGVAGWSLEDFNRYHATKLGSVGRLNRGIAARVVDPDSGREVARGEGGVLELKSAQLVNGDSWLRTNDLARLDADGFLWITGRADNAINRGGYKIAPDDVVRALESHPAVLEAAVVGVADARLGQVPAAGIRIRSGMRAPGREALERHLRERLAAYQIPVEIRVLDEFPRTASLKVDQAALRKLLEAGANP